MEMKVHNGKMDITDPCYNRGVWCAVWELDVLPGTYSVYGYVDDMGEWGNRVVCITAQHEGVIGDLDPHDIDEVISYNIGVDAGLCGFFCGKPDYKGDGMWNDFLNSTCMPDGKWDSEHKIWASPEGVFSESGFGDGIYTLYAHRNKDGVIDALKVQFIEDEDEDYEDEDWDEE